MTHKLYFTKNFKRQYKKIRRDPRWRPIFEGHVPFDSQGRSPWAYIRDSFVDRQQLPEYFYVHPLRITKALQQQIKQRVGVNEQLTIRVLELHFDGHNGDHLLVYYDNADSTTYIAIGTHSDLF